MRLSTYCRDRAFSPAYMAIINKKCQRELDLLEMEPWRALKTVSGDKLAFRQFIKAREGWETLHNMIYMEHGRNKRY